MQDALDGSPISLHRHRENYTASHSTTFTRNERPRQSTPRSEAHITPSGHLHSVQQPHLQGQTAQRQRPSYHTILQLSELVVYILILYVPGIHADDRATPMSATDRDSWVGKRRYAIHGRCRATYLPTSSTLEHIASAVYIANLQIAWPEHIHAIHLLLICIYITHPRTLSRRLAPRLEGNQHPLFPFLQIAHSPSYVHTAKLNLRACLTTASPSPSAQHW